MSYNEVGVQQYLRAQLPLDKKYGPYADIAARDAIPTEDRYELMVVGVLDGDGFGTPKVYTLKNGITNSDWFIFGEGGAGGVGGIENRYTTLTALYAGQNDQSDKGIQFVLDASDDLSISIGYAYYEYLGTTNGDLTDYRKTSDSMTKLPNFGSEAIKVLVSGVATVGIERNLLIAAETSTIDDMIELVGLSVGDKIQLRADAGDTITVKHNDVGATIKILLQNEEDFILDEIHPLELVLTTAITLVQTFEKALILTESNTWYVSSNVKNIKNGSAEFPFETIQAAHNAAVDWDTIYIMGGDYSTLTEDVNITKKLHFKGVWSGYKLQGTWTFNSTTQIMFSNLDVKISYTLSTNISIILTNCEASILQSGTRRMSVIGNNLNVTFSAANTQLRALSMSGGKVNALTRSVTVGFSANNFYHTVFLGDLIMGVDSGGGTLTLSNSNIDGDFTQTGNLNKINSVITGIEDVSGTITDDGQANKKQSFTITDSNYTDAFVIHSNTDILEFTLPASGLTNDWTPASITGVLKRNYEVRFIKLVEQNIN